MVYKHGKVRLLEHDQHDTSNSSSSQYKESYCFIDDPKLEINKN